MPKQKPAPISQEILARLDKIERQMKLDKQKLGAINDKVKSLEKSMAGVIDFLKFFKRRLLKLVK